MATQPAFMPGKSHGQRSLVATVHGVSKNWTRLSMHTCTPRFHSGLLHWYVWQYCASNAGNAAENKTSHSKVSAFERLPLVYALLEEGLHFHLYCASNLLECTEIRGNFILFIYLFLNFILFNFTILYWFCHISKWICHRYICVPYPEPSSLLPSHTIPLGCPSAPAPSIQYRASNLDWQLVSYMIFYMFQCHSPKSSHPLPLPQSPKDCSIHQWLFCCLVYRVD